MRKSLFGRGLSPRSRSYNAARWLASEVRGLISLLDSSKGEGARAGMIRAKLGSPPAVVVHALLHQGFFC